MPVIKTIPVLVAEIASATSFGDVHDCAVFSLINQRRSALKKAKSIVRCGDRRLRSDRAQQRKRHQHRRKKLSYGAS